MAKPLLIIVHGAPGTGKTTLAHRLQEDLGIGLVSKDDLKEYLFDAIGSSGRDWSKRLGQAIIPFTYELTKTVLSGGMSVLFENAFYTKFAQKELRELIEQTGCQAVEVYCHVDEPIRQQRFVDRVESGKRHPGHADSAETMQLLPVDNYGPLDICERLDVNTSHFGDAEYTDLFARILKLLPRK